jgi:hypothetical protein
LKILAVGEFDAAGVMRGHRAALTARGIDYRYAVRDVYWAEGVEANWVIGNEGGCDFASLRRFAAEADILQFAPVIGQTYSCHPEGFYPDDADVPFGPIDWHEPAFADARRVAYFNGSVNAWAHAERYGELYHRRGWVLMTSSLRYVDRLDAPFAPPVVDLGRLAPAGRRKDGEALCVVHATSNPAVSHTAEIVETCNRLGILLSVVSGLPHEVALHAKQHANCGCDHLRGVLSVGTVECASLGLAVVTGMAKQYAAVLEREMGPDVAVPWPLIESAEELEPQLLKLRDSPEATRALQQACYAWAHEVWTPQRLGARLEALYEEVLRGR